MAIGLPLFLLPVFLPSFSQCFIPVPSCPPSPVSNSAISFDRVDAHKLFIDEESLSKSRVVYHDFRDSFTDGIPFLAAGDHNLSSGGHDVQLRGAGSDEV